MSENIQAYYTYLTMRKIITYCCHLLMISTFLNCNTPIPSSDQVYKQYNKSVVLIESSYYYKIKLDNGIELFYGISSEGPDLFFDEEEVLNFPFTSTGTGFFISDKGEIATNRHVAYPDLNESEIFSQVSSIKGKFLSIIEELEIKVDEMNEYYKDNIEILSDTQVEELVTEYEEITSYIDEFQSFSNFNPKDVKIEIIRLHLGIRLDGDKLDNKESFRLCRLKLKSENEAVDLAVIQLENETTPTTIKDYFSIKNLSNYNLNPKINNHISIIGFNSGYSLANTENGIKSQMTNGNITQEPQSKKILYSIPILKGSSGSPVLDTYGDIIAVNFATYGRDNRQGFNFGVPIKQLIKLYYGEELPDLDRIGSKKANSKFAYKFENYYNQN